MEICNGCKTYICYMCDVSLMTPEKRQGKTVALDEDTYELLREFREKDERFGDAVRRAIEKAQAAPS